MNFIEEIIEKDLSEKKVDQIVTRFPPEPNGYLHIGHAKSICLNTGLAKKYGGKCNLRFDDTNPSKEEEEYVESIIRDAEWLGFCGDIYYASDYFDVMYECALKLISKGKAYVDDASPEEIRRMRGTLTEKGEESRNRNRSIDENYRLFQDMKAGKFADGSMVVRAKIDMGSPNINMRDPVIYRVLKVKHHRQGDKWNIYPMYDFAHPIEDAIENISHSVCTLEFEDHRPLYDWVLSECGFEKPPHQYEFARLNLTRTIMSKRYLKKLVDEGAVEGWDDPRMPTIAGLRRRGYTSSSIREFCERIGVSKANSEVDAAQLESCIRDELNLSADRVMAVLSPLKLVITNRDENYCEELSIENNPSDPQSGTRKVHLTQELYIEKDDFSLNPPPKYHRLTVGGMVRLKAGYIIRCVSADVDDLGEAVKVYAEIVEGTKSGEDTTGIKVKGVIHWVSAKHNVPITARLYDYLLTDEASDEDFSKRMNPNSLIVQSGFGEPILGEAAKGKSYQFMRQGYFVLDSKIGNCTFNRIVGLKDSFKKASQ